MTGGHLLSTSAFAPDSSNASSDSIMSKTQVPLETTSEPTIVMMQGDAVKVYHGVNKFEIKDASFARNLSSALRERTTEQ